MDAIDSRAFHGRFENAGPSTPAWTLGLKLLCDNIYILCNTLSCRKCHRRIVANRLACRLIEYARPEFKICQSCPGAYLAPTAASTRRDCRVQGHALPAGQIKLVQRAGQVIVCSKKHEAVLDRYLCSELMKG